MAPRTLAWLVLFALVAALALRTQSMLHPGADEALFREQDVYQHLRATIREKYVSNVEDRKLFYGAMKGMVSGLDPHSQFFTPEEYEPFKTTTSGQLEGVGIELDWSETRGLTVLTPLQGTPAWQGGVLPGDRIVKIDGAATKDMKLEQARSGIKGAPGTSVVLTLQRDGEDKLVEVTLKRAVIGMKSVLVAELLGTERTGANGPRIGYVQVSQFRPKTAAELDAALKSLEAQGMQALILDLRQNPGGLLRAAEEVADLFMASGEIVRVVNRVCDNNICKAKKEGTHPDYPLAILIDSASASASEIVSGALKDAGRAVLVGDRSYGKFSVQEVLDLPLKNWGEAGLKLTTARYKTPKQPCLDGQGIEPDYLVPSSLEQQRGLLFSRRHRHLQDNNPRAGRPVKSIAELMTEAGLSGEGGKPVEPFVDRQLQKAVEVLAGQLAPRK